MLCCGIDIGMRPKTAMAFLSLEGGVFHLEGDVLLGVSDEEIEGLVWKHRPAVVAMDAPLSTSMEKPRPAEKILRERLRGISPDFETEGSIGSPFGMMIFGITYRGRYLLQRLQNVTNVIETHPLMDYVGLYRDWTNRTIKKRKKDPTILHSALRKYVPDLPPSLTDDQYDAVIAGMVACCYATAKSPLPLLRLPKLHNTDAEFVVFADGK